LTYEGLSEGGQVNIILFLLLDKASFFMVMD